MEALAWMKKFTAKAVDVQRTKNEIKEAGEKAADASGEQASAAPNAACPRHLIDHLACLFFALVVGAAKSKSKSKAKRNKGKKKH